jgi:hypothetical protein
MKFSPSLDSESKDDVKNLESDGLKSLLDISGQLIKAVSEFND